MITGEFDPAKNREARPGKRAIPPTLSEFQKREGDVTMRVSNSRFHRVPTEAPGSTQRASTLTSEGLTHSVRQSAVLGIGRGDMRSYGVADNFAYACYDPAYRVPSPPEAPSGPLGASGAAVIRNSSSAAAIVRSTGTGASSSSVTSAFVAACCGSVGRGALRLVHPLVHRSTTDSVCARRPDFTDERGPPTAT